MTPKKEFEQWQKKVDEALAGALEDKENKPMDWRALNHQVAKICAWVSATAFLIFMAYSAITYEPSSDYDNLRGLIWAGVLLGGAAYFGFWISLSEPPEPKDDQ